jgi:hypothetical protein
MHSTRFNRGSLEDPDDPKDVVECLAIAADLLQQMFSALQALAANCAGLARAMTIRGPDVLDRLSMLHKAVDLLTALDDRSMASSSRRLATVLIAWLSDEIDELALFAASDECLGENSRVVLH